MVFKYRFYPDQHFVVLVSFTCVGMNSDSVAIVVSSSFHMFVMRVRRLSLLVGS